MIMAADIKIRVEFRYRKAWYEIGVLASRIGWRWLDRFAFRRAFQVKVAGGAWSPLVVDGK